MMKKIWLLALVAVGLLGGSAAWAGDGFYVVVGGGVGTKISSVPYTISSPGLYYLGGNLSYNGSGNAITVNADNVTLDLMGFSLTFNGSGGTPNGIFLHGRNNVEIRNGTVSGFFTGIWEDSQNGTNHRISNIRADYNTTSGGVGIILTGINHLVRGCTASHNSYGGIGFGSGTITGCVACNNGNYGITLHGAGSVLNNIANNNTLYNFKLGTADTATNIMVNGNSASGLSTNYYKPNNSTGVEISALNAGTP